MTTQGVGIYENKQALAQRGKKDSVEKGEVSKAFTGILRGTGRGLGL